MRIRIVGENLPGRSFSPSADEQYRNIHVGLQERSESVGLVPGDAPSATWDVDVRVVTEGGRLDFRGPAVHGKRGERFLYLTWGDVGAGESFHMFRRAKLMLDRVDAALVRTAEASGVLVATIDLTDDYGCPRCARVDPPAIEWSYADLS